MKKQIAAVLAASMALVAFAGCGGNNKKPNENAPVITVQNDEVYGEVGIEFDALAGVTAYDEEDGDLTSSITVEAEGLTFTNGKTTPTESGVYELIYSVKDSGDKTDEAYCTLVVEEGLGPEQTVANYGSADFTNGGATVNKGGWSHVIASPATGSADCKPGAYIFDITNPGTTQDDVALTKEVDLPAGTHSVSVWAKADKTTYGKIVIKNEAATVVKEMDAVEIGTALTEIKLEFELEAELDGEICICLGKMENTPASYNVTVTKINRTETTGSANKINAYTEDFSTSAESVTASFWGDSVGSVTNNNGAAQVNITNYPTANNHVWELHFFVALGDHAIEKDKTYAYSMEITAQNAQSKVEFALAKKGDVDSGIYDTAGGFSYNMAFSAGATKKLSGTFTASKNIDEPALLFKAGDYSENDGLTSNVYTIDNVEFYEVGAGTTVETTPYVDSFELTGGTEKPWVAYHEGDAIGALYTENGKLIYRADQIDGVDWHNKVQIGRGDSKFDLLENTYVTISMTVKASKNVTCVMNLFKGGDWDL